MPYRLKPLWKWPAAVALCACSALPAFSQVIRCTDAKTGQVTYTDGKCAAGAATHEVEAKRSAEEIEQERRSAEQALELKQQRLQAESAAASAQNQREIEQERLRAARAAASAPPAQRLRQLTRMRQIAQESGAGVDRPVSLQLRPGDAH